MTAGRLVLDHIRRPRVPFFPFGGSFTSLSALAGSLVFESIIFFFLSFFPVLLPMGMPELFFILGPPPLPPWGEVDPYEKGVDGGPVCVEGAGVYDTGGREEGGRVSDTGGGEEGA